MTPGMDALAEAMRHEQARIYGQTLPDRRTKFVPPLPESGTGPADPEVLAELVADLTVSAVPTPKLEAVSRVAIEQRIARGDDNERIAANLHAPISQVRAVRNDLNRIAS